MFWNIIGNELPKAIIFPPKKEIQPPHRNLWLLIKIRSVSKSCMYYKMIKFVVIGFNGFKIMKIGFLVKKKNSFLPRTLSRDFILIVLK